MIQTTKDHTKTVSSLSDQALASVAKREEHLKQKKTAWMNRKRIENGQRICGTYTRYDLKEKADETVKSLEKRYASYDQLYKEYQKALKQDQHLYQSLKKKDLGYKELKSKLKTVNRSYSKVRKEGKKVQSIYKAIE
ncbi:YkyA family protein [Bacillus sp. SL00103]